MNALLLSAGMGERLRPLTLYLPKCLLPITPYGTLLKYWIDLLFGMNIDEIFINAFWKKEKIKDYVDTLDHYRRLSVKVYMMDKLESIGTVIHNLRGSLGDSFLVINSDTYIDREDVRTFIDCAKVSETKPICLGVSWQKNVVGKSLVSLAAGNLVYDFQEKPEEPQEGYSYAGMLLMHTNMANTIYYLKNTERELTRDILPLFKNCMTAVDVGEIIDIGSDVAGYYKAVEDISKRTSND